MSRSAAELATDLQAEKAIRRVLAVEMSAAVTFWESVFDGTWLRAFSISGTLHGLVLITSAAGAAWLLGPIAARARDAGRAAGRTITLSVVVGVIVTVATIPLTRIGMIQSAAHTLAESAFSGAALGFFAGLAASPVVVHHLVIRRIRSLDGASRLYVAGNAALLVLAITALIVFLKGAVVWAGIVGALLFATAAGFGALAIHLGSPLSGPAAGERMAADLHVPSLQKGPGCYGQRVPGSWKGFCWWWRLSPL